MWIVNGGLQEVLVDFLLIVDELLQLIIRHVQRLLTWLASHGVYVAQPLNDLPLLLFEPLGVFLAHHDHVVLHFGFQILHVEVDRLVIDACSLLKFFHLLLVEGFLGLFALAFALD